MTLRNRKQLLNLKKPKLPIKTVTFLCGISFLSNTLTPTVHAMFPVYLLQPAYMMQPGYVGAAPYGIQRPEFPAGLPHYYSTMLMVAAQPIFFLPPLQMPGFWPQMGPANFAFPFQGHASGLQAIQQLAQASSPADQRQTAPVMAAQTNYLQAMAEQKKPAQIAGAFAQMGSALFHNPQDAVVKAARNHQKQLELQEATQAHRALVRVAQSYAELSKQFAEKIHPLHPHLFQYAHELSEATHQFSNVLENPSNPRVPAARAYLMEAYERLANAWPGRTAAPRSYTQMAAPELPGRMSIAAPPPVVPLFLPNGNHPMGDPQEFKQLHKKHLDEIKHTYQSEIDELAHLRRRPPGDQSASSNHDTHLARIRALEQEKQDQIKRYSMEQHAEDQQRAQLEAKILRLKEKRKKDQTLTADLIREIEQLKADVLGHLSREAHQNNEIERLRREHGSHDERLALLQADHRNLQQETSLLKAQHAHERDELSDRLRKLQDEKKNLKSQIDRFRDQGRGSEDQVRRLQFDHDRALRDINILLGERQQLETGMHQALRANDEDYQDQIRELRNIIRELKLRNEKDHSHSEARENALNNRHSDLVRKLREVEQERDTIRKDLESRADELPGMFDEQRAAHKDEISAHRTEIAHLKSLLENAKKEIAKSKGEHPENEVELKRQMSELAKSLHEKILEANHLISQRSKETNEELRRLQGELEQALRKLQEERAGHSASDEHVTKLQEELRQKEAKFREEFEKIRQDRQNLEQTHNQLLRDHEKALAAHQEETSRQKAHIDQLKQELQSHVGHPSLELEQLKVQLNLELGKYEKNIADLDYAHHQLRQELKRMQDERDRLQQLLSQQSALNLQLQEQPEQGQATHSELQRIKEELRKAKEELVAHQQQQDQQKAALESQLKSAVRERDEIDGAFRKLEEQVGQLNANTDQVIQDAARSREERERLKHDITIHLHNHQQAIERIHADHAAALADQQSKFERERELLGDEIQRKAAEIIALKQEARAQSPDPAQSRRIQELEKQIAELTINLHAKDLALEKRRDTADVGVDPMEGYAEGAGMITGGVAHSLSMNATGGGAAKPAISTSGAPAGGSLGHTKTAVTKGVIPHKKPSISELPHLIGRVKESEIKQLKDALKRFLETISNKLSDSKTKENYKAKVDELAKLVNAEDIENVYNQLHSEIIGPMHSFLGKSPDYVDPSSDYILDCNKELERFIGSLLITANDHQIRLKFGKKLEKLLEDIRPQTQDARSQVKQEYNRALDDCLELPNQFLKVIELEKRMSDISNRLLHEKDSE